MRRASDAAERARLAGSSATGDRITPPRISDHPGGGRWAWIQRALPLVRARRRLRLFEERQTLHGEAVAEQVVLLPTQILGEEQSRVAEQQRRLADQVLRQLPGARQELVAGEHFGDEAEAQRFRRVERLSRHQ